MHVPAPARASFGPDGPVSWEGDIGAVFMRDSTLRRGDIIVFPDGPRVFNGKSRNTLHQMSDFEDLGASLLVTEQTRQDILAATTQSPPRDEVRLSFTARPSNRRKR